MELDALQKSLESIRELGASLVAISPQTTAHSAAVKEKHSLDYPILSDPGNAYARQLALTFTMPDDLREVYRAFEIDLPAYNADNTWQLPLPARVVVDGSGVIRSLDADADYTIRPDPAATLEVLRTLVS